jgi:hypothetical protein
MFALFRSRLAVPVARLAVRRSAKSSAEADVQALIARIRQRLYPETIPVLARYWLKTVCAREQEHRWWKELNRLLKAATREPSLDGSSRALIAEIQRGVEETIVRPGTLPKPVSLPPPSFQAPLSSQWMRVYLVRLLNEWLPVEVARILTAESERGHKADGIPALALGLALERLLARKPLSQKALEMLIEPGLASPKSVYPADLEILRDVVLWLLGRTHAPEPPVLPATLFSMAANSPLPADYAEAVRQAFLAGPATSVEVHVPLAPAEALEILKNEQLRIGSIVVTIDGRWWKAESIHTGERHSVAYRLAGHLRIDYSGEHARLRAPWPDHQLHWSGDGHFGHLFKLFGREWHVVKLEVDSESTWLDLEFSRILPAAELFPPAAMASRSLWPVSVDLAWAALENGLRISLRQKNTEAIERLRHSDLIPAGRALLRLTESVIKWWRLNDQAIETELRALRHPMNPVVAKYGRIPWRILPEPLRAALLKARRSPQVVELLHELVGGVPEALRPASDQLASPGLNSPPHAA